MANQHDTYITIGREESKARAQINNRSRVVVDVRARPAGAAAAPQQEVVIASLLAGVVDNVALAPPGAAHILENSQPKPFRKNLIVAIFLPKY